MDGSGRWVSKAVAARELAISLSTLDRKIRRGEVEVVREGRRVYVRVHGPEQLSNAELLRRASSRVDELERTVRGVEQSVSEWRLRASELEHERDEARESAVTARRPYLGLEGKFQKEVAAHRETRRLAIRLGLVVVALFVISALLTWRLLT